MGRGKALAAEGFSLTGAVGGPTLPAHTGPSSTSPHFLIESQLN